MGHHSGEGHRAVGMSFVLKWSMERCTISLSKSVYKRNETVIRIFTFSEGTLSLHVRKRYENAHSFDLLKLESAEVSLVLCISLHIERRSNLRHLTLCWLPICPPWILSYTVIPASFPQTHSPILSRNHPQSISPSPFPSLNAPSFQKEITDLMPLINHPRRLLSY